MYNPFGGNKFPYSNFHGLNMDWIIEIAKNFLDQYTNIQEMITNGEENISNLTTEGLEQLQEKADTLEALLQQWYNTHSEDIANQLADAIQEFTTEASAKAQEALQSIPGDYTDLSSRVGNLSRFAEVQNLTYQKGYYRESDGALVDTGAGTVFACTSNFVDTTNKKIIDIYNTSLDLTTIFVTLHDANGFVRNETLTTTDTTVLHHNHYIVPDNITKVYINYIGQSGMTTQYVERYTITTLTNFNYDVVKNSQMAIFVTQSNPMRYIEYNTVSRTLKFPSDSVVLYGNKKNFGVADYTMDLSTGLARCIWALDNNTLVDTEYSTQPASNNPHLLGYVYRNNVFINGVNPDHIKYINGTEIYTLSNKHHSGSYITIHDGVHPHQYGETSGSVVYDRTNKSLFISGDAFLIYRGTNVGERPITVDLSAIPGTTTFAWKLYMKPNGNIYAINWSADPDNNADDCIGYGYNDSVWIEGIPQYAIEEVDLYSKVYCFGDSIVAGVGATENFHQFWHRWYRNIHCYNWGVGGTGWYHKQANGTTMGGSENNYAPGLVVSAPEDNNVIGMMQYIEDDIDYAVILAGTNDYGANVTSANFRIAVQNTLNYALTRTGFILVITPVRRTNGETPNNVGMKLSDYSAIIKEECISRSIPCVDGYDIAINPDNNTQKARFIPDGLHPNTSGHNRIAHHAMSKFYEAITLTKILK